MARRNHSRRVHAPYRDPGAGYGEGYGGQQGVGTRQDAGEDEGVMGYWGTVRGAISERPHTSVMTAFGVGFGLGLVVTLLLSQDREDGWFERYAPDAIQDLPGRLSRAGHKLSDSMSESIKHAGESLASYVPSSWKR